jgi:Putative zinc-finger
MNCKESRRYLPGYLDGAISAEEHAVLREHLDSCGLCRQELEQYQLLTTHLANLEPAAAPENLALQIRLNASNTRSPSDLFQTVWTKAVLISANVLKPLAVPATGGVLTALGIFVLFVGSVLAGIPLGRPVPNDQPLNFVQPAELESLGPLGVSGIVDAAGTMSSNGLLLEATLNAQGQVLFYRILAGPNNAAVQRQIDQVLLLSRFRPELSFGRPMDGGRVVLSFSEIHVRG